MQRYKVFSGIDLLSTAGTETIWRGGIDMNIAFEVEAALAAKDAEIERLLSRRNRLLHIIADVQQALGFTPDEMSIADGSAQMVERIRQIRGDTARLDKLPACFHMLRTCPGTKPDSPWWYSYETNTEYETLRDAIDAHKGAE